MTDTKQKIEKYLAIVVSVIAILMAIGSFANTKAKTAVFEYKILQNETEIKELKVKTGDIPVIQTNMKNMAEDVAEIKDDIKAFAEAWNNWMREH